MNHELESPSLSDQVGDTLVDASLRKDTVLERLNKRNKDRQNYLDVKIEQRNKENVQLEGEDYFSQVFTQRIHDIEARIENINETATKKTKNDAIPATDLVRLFSDITLEIQELQRYLTTSTMFLTDFKIKTCQNMLNELMSHVDDTRLRLMPKKKFGFSSKKIATKPNIAIDTSDTVAKSKISATNNVFSWTLSNRQNEYICLSDNEVNGQDITITNLVNCFVELQGHAGSVQMANTVDCTFLCGPIARSLFAENCQNATIAAACQQLRLHTSTECRIYLHVTCRAIIEDCKKIEIADYNYDYPQIDQDFQKANLNRMHNNYTDVADFNWLSPDAPSPNWKLLKDNIDVEWNIIREKFQESLVADNRQL